MRSTTYIILFLTLCIQLSGQGSIQFDPNQFQREATDQVLEKIESTVMEKIEMAIAAGEKKLTEAIYLQDVLEPLRSYGIDPEKEGYYKDIQHFYEEYTNNPDFDPRANVQAAFTEMIKTKITGEIYAVIGKANIEMAGEFQTIFTNASEKITSILEALESVSHIEDVEERQSEFKKVAKQIGLTGKFFEAVGDLEVLVGQTVDRLADPLQIITAVVNATAETNPTNKIKMLFDFGENYGGRIPIVGDIVQALFTVGKKLIEAAEMAGGLIESNVDQYCIYEAGSHNYAGNSKKESFVQSHPGVSICPLRNKGVYTNIYVNQDNYRQIYFYVDGQWIDGKFDQYHSGGDDIFALVQWLRGNGFTNEAVDLKFLSKAYNHNYGFRYFRDIGISGKLVEIAKLSKSIISKLNRCDDQELERFFDKEIGFSYLDVTMRDHGGFKLVDIAVMSSNIKEITDEIIIWRYIYNTLSHVESLEDIYQNLLVSQPVRIYGKITDEKRKALSDVEVQPSGQGIVFFRGTNCDKSRSNENGEFSFFYIPVSRSQNVTSLIARYEGIVEKGEILLNGVVNNYELNFEFNLGKEEDQSEVDNDGDGFSIKVDCNDEDASINPDAIEIKDNDIDENCDGIVEYSTTEDIMEKEVHGELIISPSSETIFIDEEINLQVYWVDENGEREEVTDEAMISNPFKSKRTGEFKVKAIFEGLEAIAIITVEKDERKCKGDNEVWNEDLSICHCKKGYTRNDEGSCIPLSEFIESGSNMCLNEHEVWNADLLACECEEGYKRNANDKCVEIVEGNDPSGNINKCLNEHEVWNADLLACECEEGYKRNANDQCVEIVEGNDPSGNINTCLNEHEVWNADLLLCECEEGYKRNANDKCVEIVEGNDPSGNINTCLRENEVWNSTRLECECISGYTRDALGVCVKGNSNVSCDCPKGQVCDAEGNCIPIEDAITMAEEGIEKDCPDFNQVEVNLRALISQHRSIEHQINNYIRKFEKEINDRAAIPCENKLLGFTYYSVYALLDRLYQIENELGDIYFSQISFFSLNGQCPDFSNAMSAAGLDNSFISNELKKYQILNDRVADLDALLIENGCDPEVVIQEGQTIQPPGSDPDFIDNGGTSTEIDGDGKDNDGDGQQDEIPVQGLPGYNVTIVVYDSGSGKDDIFGLSIGGQGFLGNSPKGGLRSYGLNLPPGNYSGTLEVVLAADDIGTYTINILHRQENIYFDTGDPPEGTRIPFSFEIIE